MLWRDMLVLLLLPTGGAFPADSVAGTVRVDVTVTDIRGVQRPPPRRAELQVEDAPWQSIALPWVFAATGETLRVALRAEGYENPSPLRVDLAPDRETAVTFALVPRPVQVVIRCNPPEAELFDGTQRVGRAGYAMATPAYVTRRLVVRAPRHHETVLHIEGLDPGKPPPPYDVELPFLPSHLRVEAETPDRLRRMPRAEIALDGAVIATARLPHVVANLTQDVVRVAITVPGFLPAEPRAVHLEPGAETRVSFPLQFPDAAFEFRVLPTNAVVSVSDERLATNRLPVIPRRLYAIRIEAPGHRPMEFIDAAEPGEVRVIEKALQPRTYLQFELTPTGAVVFIAGHRLTDRKVEIQPHRAYQITIRAPGHQSEQLRTCAETGETKLIKVDLKRRLFDF